MNTRWQSVPSVVLRESRLVCEAYCARSEFTSDQDFLATLSEYLDDLCVALGVEPPRFETGSLEVAG